MLWRRLSKLGETITETLEAAINRLDRFHLLILDDLAYVSKDQAETSVLFELISARYERRSTLITARPGRRNDHFQPNKET